MAHYDPQARRDTPLARKLAARIRREGPLSVARYMEACLHDPDHGYYVRRPAIGAAGDFVTAPEISQVFGELIGLWCVVAWQQMGAPNRFDLVELGPGRGTMMADALRAARVVPAFLAAVRVELVETNRSLIAEQQRAMRDVGVPVTWASSFVAHERRSPTALVANELLDTLPVEQLFLTEDGWQQRTVELDAQGRLAYGCLPSRDHPNLTRAPARVGDVLELRSPTALLREIATVAAGAPLAALLIDYGHAASATGDTLQAVRNHRYEHPLTSPGEADLTAQVDFAEVAARAASLGLTVDGPVAQGRFLAALGATERASRLMAQNPSKAAAIEAGVARLMSPTGMGARFLCVGLRSPQLQALPGLASA